MKWIQKNWGKMAVFFLLGIVLTVAADAVAIPKAMAAPKAPQYSLSPKSGTILQAVPDRGIAPKEGSAPRADITGESPTTGLPWQGDYQPMLVQISNAPGTARVQGRDIKAAGIGKTAPWGVQHADIAYEGMLFSGSTRFAFLFSDCFAMGQPASGVGPVRSTRREWLALREEWQAGFVHSGGYGGTFGWRDVKTAEMLEQTGASAQGVLFNLLGERYQALKHRVQGVKAPDNFHADIAGIRELIPAAHTARPRPFRFADENPYVDGYAPAKTIHLDWGGKAYISHFQYDEERAAYLRFCGTGMDETKWTPFRAFADVDDRSEENMVLLASENVIIQRVAYSYASERAMTADVQTIGQGNADIFIGGRYIPGYWVRKSIEEPTVFYDDLGQELRLMRGKTFIALFPTEGLCVFEDGGQP